jgi:DNA-binding response OmpR family regulator
VEGRRMVLAAWVSALPFDSPMRPALLSSHNVAEILEPDPHAPRCAAAETLDLVCAYQYFRSDAGEQKLTPSVLRRKLEREWAVTPERGTLLRRFLQLLREESFLLEPGGQTTATILIVDPAECVTPVISSLLAQQGFDVGLAENVEEARVVLREAVPDVILCRKDLPIENGLDFCAALRNQPATRHTPVFLLLEKQNRHAVREGLRAGAQDVLTLPLDVEGLVLRINHLLDQRPLAAKPTPPAAAGANAALVGSLAQVEFSDLVQILVTRTRDTKVSFHRPDGANGDLFFKDGNVVHAQTMTHLGDEAVFELMRWKDASFTVYNETCAAEPTIRNSVMGLLMEGAQRIDEKT